MVGMFRDESESSGSVVEKATKRTKFLIMQFDLIWCRNMKWNASSGKQKGQRVEPHSDLIKMLNVALPFQWGPKELDSFKSLGTVKLNRFPSQ